MKIKFLVWIIFLISSFNVFSVENGDELYVKNKNTIIENQHIVDFQIQAAQGTFEFGDEFSGKTSSLNFVLDLGLKFYPFQAGIYLGSGVDKVSVDKSSYDYFSGNLKTKKVGLFTHYLLSDSWILSARFTFYKAADIDQLNYIEYHTDSSDHSHDFSESISRAGVFNGRDIEIGINFKFNQTFSIGSNFFHTKYYTKSSATPNSQDSSYYDLTNNLPKELTNTGLSFNLTLSFDSYL